MSSLEISFVTLGCLMAGVLLGMWLQYRLPGHHLSKESQDTVKLASGVIATMSAMVLGLLVSSAKSSLDNVNNSIAANGSRIIQLDHLLESYGSETKPLREQLKTSLAARIKNIWAGGGLQDIEHSTDILNFQGRLRQLQPASEEQKVIFTQAQQISSEVAQSRLLIVEEQQESVPVVFLLLLVFWLTLLFVSFGLFAPRNFTVVTVLFVCAFSVSSAVFLILEMSHPLDGIIKASNAPLLKALEFIGH